jgi:purine-nucleoside phosphorylase
MPGDPLRAKLIAETYLEDYELVNNVRGVQGYTGYYEGKRVSVMASGMGMPSMGIYSFELYHIFGVETIIRIGSAGGIHPDLKLFDLVLAQGACTNSAYFSQYGLTGSFAPIADFDTLRRAADECEKRGLQYKVGNLLSSDLFYSEAGMEGTMEWGSSDTRGSKWKPLRHYMNAARAR